MRKAVILLTLLLLCAAGGAAYLSDAVYETRDDVTITPVHHYGDKAALAGATAELHATYDQFLFWDVGYDFEKETVTGTDYRFSPQQLYERGKVRFDGLWMDTDLSYTMDEEIPEEELSDFARACRELAEKVPAGGEQTETIRLADYMDYYELSLSLNLPYAQVSHSDAYDPGWLSEAEQKVTEDIRDFFKIGVLRDEYREVTIGKHENGSLSHMGTGSASWGDYYYTNITCAVTDDACFITLRGTSALGKAMDFSAVPGGYGIYRLPFGAPTYSDDGYSYTDLGIRADELEMVYPLAQDIDILNFMTSADHSRLLLFTAEEEKYILTVIDTATMETLQRLTLCDYPADGWGGGSIYDGGDFLVSQVYAPGGSAELVLLTIDDAGGYHLEFVVDSEARHNPFFDTSGATSMTWNGEKLILCGTITETEVYWDYTCDFFALVYDETGLLYCGEFQNSIETMDEYRDYGYPVRPLQDDPIEVSW